MTPHEHVKVCVVLSKTPMKLLPLPNYYWTAELRCCTEYLRSLALCEWEILAAITRLRDGKRTLPLRGF
ncbi:hypothetical protein XACM_2489 [Xanthomonas euvesicatoria pv. citrumelo F1]|nr:hypothetical protein XACM_2489 [Xanthomonas euvesicatoria pv. citrumelo F1]